jgi:DNA segregation ATPase FtsK/SpoIIIE, S-DNA-T family
MATRAGSRPIPSNVARPTTRRKPKKENVSFFARVGSFGRTLLVPGRMIPAPSAINRELIGGLSALIGLITTWSMLAGDSNGMLVAAVDDMLGWLTGRAPYVIPVLAIFLAVQCFRSRPGPSISLNQLSGGLLFAIAVPALTQAAAVGTMRDRGGITGREIFNGLDSLLGEVPSVLLLLAAGIASVFLISGVTPMYLLQELGRIGRVIYRPLPPFEDVDIFDALPAIPHMPFPTESVTKSTDVGPVINTPRTGTPVAAKKQTAPLLMPKALPIDAHMPLPSVAKLHLYEQVALDKGDLTIKARRIEETLASFKVDAKVREINPGPAVTQYTLEPGPGTKVRRITELQNDLALALAAPSIRIEAPVPGLARVGLEIPNAKVATVGLRETLESDRFVNGKFKLPIPLGRDVNGNYVIHDLTRMPHLLIAGATGSGKSVCLTAIISTFLASKRPTELKLLMMDPKMVELVGYNGVPHLQCPVVTEMDKVVGALRLALLEMERRYSLFAKMGVRNLDGYRMKVADELGAEEIPYLVVIIDELADLMMTAPDDVETVLCRIAQMGRAAGIHLIIATQRPSVDVLTGLIKANVPARIAFAVTSLTDSRVVLDMPGAERLLGRGDMLFLPPDAAKPVRIQGAFIEDGDVQFIVDHWHSISPIPTYAPEWIDLPSSNSPAEPEDSSDDPLLDQAMEIVKTQGTASASMLQRRLRIGYNRAARLIEQMESDGLIGPADGIKGRPVL